MERKKFYNIPDYFNHFGNLGSPYIKNIIGVYLYLIS